MEEGSGAKPTVGFIGLGPLGAPMAKRVLRAGFRLQIYDFEADAVRYFHMETGGEIAANPRMMAETCDIVLVMLARPAEVRAIATGREGVVHGFGPGKLLVDMSASAPSQTKEIAKELHRAGLAMIDAPPLGGLAELRSGKLVLLAGGEDEVVERCRPVLESFGSRLIRTGPVGSAHAAKALCGQLTALCLLATAEAVVIGRRAGLDPGPLLEALNASAGTNYAPQETIPRQVLSRDFGSGIGLDAVMADLQHALEMAREGELPAPLSALCREMWATARLSLGPGQDHTRLVRWLEQLAKVGLTGSR